MDYMPKKTFPENRSNERDPLAQYAGYLNRNRERLEKLNPEERDQKSLREELHQRSFSGTQNEQFRFDEHQYAIIEQ